MGLGRTFCTATRFTEVFTETPSSPTAKGDAPLPAPNIHSHGAPPSTAQHGRPSVLQPRGSQAAGREVSAGRPLCLTSVNLSPPHLCGAQGQTAITSPLGQSLLTTKWAEHVK